MPSKTPRAADAVPMVVRVAHKAPSVIRVEGTIISRLRRPIRLGPSRSNSTCRALCDREGGGGATRALCSLREKFRWGVITHFARHPVTFLSYFLRLYLSIFHMLHDLSIITLSIFFTLSFLHRHEVEDKCT